MGKTIVLVIIAVAVGMIGFSMSASGSPRVEVGKKAPDFTLSDLSGNKVTLSDLKGKVVLLNFFATWCPPCRDEASDVDAFSREYQSRDIVVLAVDLKEDPAIVREFMTRNKLSFPVVMDDTGKVSDLYRITGVPTWFIIDRNGFIKAVKEGPMSKSEMVMRSLAIP